MHPVVEFLQGIDSAWSPSGPGILLHVLGSAALFLQTDYRRGTKDGDVLETQALVEPTRSRLLTLAGPGTPLHRSHGLYLDIVSPNVPMLPPEPAWHPHPIALEHFEIHVLDPHDVVVSKLRRWNAGDRDDARAMVESSHLDRGRLVGRFREVVARYTFDARADLLPLMANRLNIIERDWFVLDPTPFDFPEDIFR